MKLVSGSPTPATAVSTQTFTVLASEPKDDGVFSATYNLVMVDSHPPASRVDMLGAGGDAISHQDMGGDAPGQDSAPTGKVGCGRSLVGIY